MAGFPGVVGGALKNNPIAQANDLAGQYQREGFFNPYGSPRLRALRRRAALQRRQAMMQANQGAAQLYGLDPMQQRAALAQGNVYGNAATSGELANADLQTEQEQAGFGRQLFMGNLDYARQRQLQKELAKQQSQGGIGAAFGGLVGNVAGGWLSPGGLFKGK